LFTSVAIILAAGAIYAGFFYWQNLRGLGPALDKPLVDIVTVVNKPQWPLTLPSNFQISIYASGLVNPRVIFLDPSGVMVVSVPSEGKVLALPEKGNTGVADKVITVAEGLNKPHGIAFKCDGNSCKIYIAETDRVVVYNYDKITFKATNGKKIIDLPGGGNHFTRTLMLYNTQRGERLLIAVGSDCNVCNESDWHRAKILSANLDGSDLKVFSSGLRNSVFMTIHPVTGKIWATEMGRDLLGDNIPPDEINIIEEGKNYGWPICYGKNIHDTEFDKNTYIRNPCMEPFEKPSHIDIQAHSAPLGLAFVSANTGWLKEYANNLFVAYHGSWNRSVPTGYKVVRYKLDAQGKYLGMEDFITGWLTPDGKTAYGRPVGILVQPNGEMYITDDKAGVIYRVKAIYIK